MKNFFVITTLCAIAALSAEANSGGLRTLKKSNDPPGTPPHCKGLVGNPSNQDRYCESSQTSSRENQCGCKEQCHIWGDPHVEPFYSGCDVLTLKEEGWYTFFDNGMTGKSAVQVSGRSKALTKNKKDLWISEVLVKNGNSESTLLSLSDCEMKSDDRRIQTINVKPPGYKYTVDIVITAYCDQNGKSPLHVNSFVEVIDNCVDEAGLETSENDQVPTSVTMFPAGSGICINPCNNGASYRGNGDKPDGSSTRTLEVDEEGAKECQYKKGWFWDEEYGSKACVRRPGGIDGRVCSYTAQCSVHGDPYLTDFYTEMLEDDSQMCKTSGKNKQCIQIYPIEDQKGDSYLTQQENMQTRELYMVPGQYQLQAITDDCHLVTEVIASYTSKGMTAHYKAEDLCPKTGTAGSTSVIIKAPSDQKSGNKNIDKVNKKVYDEFSFGFPLEADENNLEPGSVVANLKCHITNPKENDAGEMVTRVYFNVCVERYNGQQVEDGEFTYNGQYRDIEHGIKSRGWCATGDVVGQQQDAGTQSVEYQWEYVQQEETVLYSEECALGSKGKC